MCQSAGCEKIEQLTDAVTDGILFCNKPIKRAIMTTLYLGSD